MSLATDEGFSGEADCGRMQGGNGIRGSLEYDGDGGESRNVVEAGHILFR